MDTKKFAVLSVCFGAILIVFGTALPFIISSDKIHPSIMIVLLMTIIFWGFVIAKAVWRYMKDD